MKINKKRNNYLNNKDCTFLLKLKLIIFKKFTNNKLRTTH